MQKKPYKKLYLDAVGKLSQIEKDGNLAVIERDVLREKIPELREKIRELTRANIELDEKLNDKVGLADLSTIRVDYANSLRINEALRKIVSKKDKLTLWDKVLFLVHSKRTE